MGRREIADDVGSAGKRSDKGLHAKMTVGITDTIDDNRVVQNFLALEAWQVKLGDSWFVSKNC